MCNDECAVEWYVTWVAVFDMLLQVEDVDALIAGFCSGFEPGASGLTLLRRYGMFDVFNPPGDGKMAGPTAGLVYWVEGRVWECGRGCFMLGVLSCSADC